MPLSEVLAFAWHAVRSLSGELLFIAGAIVFELVIRSRSLSRYVSRGYVVDLGYCAFYRLFFSMMFEAPVTGFITAHLGGPLVPAVPLWGRVVAYLLILEFVNYWIHRLEHRVPWLWAFHQVHHSQEHLTIMATYRNHPLDVWLRSIVGPVVFMFLLGLPPAIWFPVSLWWDINLNLSHLEVNWTYGPLGWIFVSPTFHSVHHSTDTRHQNRNFGMTLAVWDWVFGTGLMTRERPTRFGLPGWSVRESALTHAWTPVRAIVRHYRGLPDPELAPLADAPPASATPPDASGATVSV